MSSELGPIDIECDAPPYVVVRACARLGLVSPEDVRWCHLRRVPDRHGSEPPQGESAWNVFANANRSASVEHCSCGEPLPVLGRYSFLFNTGEEFICSVGQCSRCHTIFWKDS